MYRKKILSFGIDMVTASMVTPDSKFVRDVLNKNWTAVDEFIQVILDGGSPFRFIGTAELPRNFTKFGRELLGSHGIHRNAIPGVSPSAPYPPPPTAPGTVSFPEYPETTPQPTPSWYTSIRNNLSSPMGLERITTVVQTMVGWAIILAVGWLLVAGLTYTAVAGWRLIDASFAGGSVAAGECGLNATVLEARFAALEDNITGLDNKVVFFRDISRDVVASMHDAGNATLDRIEKDVGIFLAKQEKVLVEVKGKATAAFAAQEAALESSNQVLDTRARNAEKKYNVHMDVLFKESAKMAGNISDLRAEISETNSYLNLTWKKYEEINHESYRLSDRLDDLFLYGIRLEKIQDNVSILDNKTHEALATLNYVAGEWSWLFQLTTAYFAGLILASLCFVRIWGNSSLAYKPLTPLESSHPLGLKIHRMQGELTRLRADVEVLKTPAGRVMSFVWNAVFGSGV